MRKQIKKYDAKEVSKTVGDMVQLGFLISAHTKYAAYVEYAGHVEGVYVRISQDKEEGMNNTIYSQDAYVGDEWHGRTNGESLKKLETMKNHLKKFLEDNTKVTL